MNEKSISEWLIWLGKTAKRTERKGDCYFFYYDTCVGAVAVSKKMAGELEHEIFLDEKLIVVRDKG
jgi:hypothetical protein